MQQETEQGQHTAGGAETAAHDEAPVTGEPTPGDAAEPNGTPTDATSDAGTDSEVDSAAVAADITWRVLPTLGDGLLRMLAAVVLGALTGLVWGVVGHTVPARVSQACAWALALYAVPLLAAVAGLPMDGDVRAALGLRTVRRPLAEMAIALVLLMVCTAAAAVSDVTALAAPVTLILALGVALGFALGGLRLRRMSGDARWFFVGLGVLGLFGLVVTFLLPAALAPLANGQQGVLGCLLFVFGLPTVVLGTVAGGWQRMRVERAAFGSPPPLEDAFPLELAEDHWSRRAPLAPHPLDMSVGESEEHDMTQPMTADAVIEELTSRRQVVLESVAGLSDEQLDRKGVVGDWSIKNALAHLVDWEEVVVRITPERLRTRAKPAELQELNADEDGYNARTVAAGEALTPQDQLVKAAEARARLVELIRGLGDEALAGTNPWPEWQGTLGEYFVAALGDHESEHAGAIAAGAAQLRAESR